MLSRRGLLGSLICAPAIIRTPGLLMPIKSLREFAMIVSVSHDGENWHTAQPGSYYAVGDVITFSPAFSAGDHIKVEYGYDF
jgi:hypothetical protein